MPSTRSQDNSLALINSEIYRLFRRMAPVNEDVMVGEEMNINDDMGREENPPPRDDRPQLRDFNENTYGWNQYRLNPMPIDVTGVIVLPQLPADAKFSLSNGLLQMLQNHGLFIGLPSEDPHCHLQNVVFVCKSVMGT